MKIEPTALAWEARVLPMYDARLAVLRQHSSVRRAAFNNQTITAARVHTWGQVPLTQGAFRRGPVGDLCLGLLGPTALAVVQGEPRLPLGVGERRRARLKKAGQGRQLLA